MVYDEIELEDLDIIDGVYTYPCPCGDVFTITQDDIDNGEEIARCKSCTLVIRVIF